MRDCKTFFTKKLVLGMEDLVVIIASCYLTNAVLTITDMLLLSMVQRLEPAFVLAVCIGVSFNINDLYTVLYKRFAEILLALFVSLLQAAVVAYVFFTAVMPNPYWGVYLASFAAISFIMMVCLRYVTWLAAKSDQKVRYAFIVGTDEECSRLYGKFKRHPYLGIELRFVSAALHETPDWYQAGLKSDIIFVGAHLATSEKEQILLFANEHGKEMRFIPNVYDVACNQSFLSRVDDIPLLRPKDLFLTAEKRAVKRALDLMLAAVALIGAFPCMMVVAVLVKLTSRGDILYSQTRVGQNGKLFKVYKFRTMTMDAEKQSGPVMAHENDPRITPIGRILRMTRLDELPQIWNVVVGDMSLVGPRPERPVFVEEFNKMIPAYHYRHNVKPGITGFAQIFGKYNTTAADKLVYDLMYIQNCSLKQDVVLILQTIRVLFTKSSTEGYNHGGEEDSLEAFRLKNICL